MADRRNQSRRLSETERGHAAVNRLVSSSRDEICLVPDTDVTAAVGESLVERDPCGPVLAVPAPCVRFQMLERSPVLHDHFRSGNRTEKSRVRPGLQLLQHFWHSQEYRQPLVQLPGLVDAHAD